MRNRSRNLSRMRRAPQCSIPHVELDPATVEATPEEIRENVKALHDNFDFWAELRDEANLQKWRRFQADLSWYRDNIGGGINLELSLMIMLLVLVCVLAVSPLGSGIANQYAAAAGFLTGAASYTSPTVSQPPVDNGDGSHEIRWDNGEPPFQIIRSTQPDMSNPEIVGSTPDRSYTVIPDPGKNYFGIIDNRGAKVPPIEITAPLPAAADCETYQMQIAADAFQWAQAEVLSSGERPIAAPADLDAFYAAVLPYGISTRHLCPTAGEFTYYNPASNPAGVFVFLQCPSHPATEQVVKRYCYINQMVIETAAANYHADFGVYPSGIFELVPGYIPEMPQCPAGGPPYALNPDGTVADCWGGSPAHGHY